MTVTVQIPFTEYIAAPGATTFATTFRLIEQRDLLVTVNGAIVTSGFTVSGLPLGPTASVVFSAPMVGGEAIRLERVIKLERQNSYQFEGDFQADVVNQDFDRPWMALQDFGVKTTVNISRTMRAPFGEVLRDIPQAAARANKIQAYDDSGQPIAVLPGSGTASEVLINLAGTGAGQGASMVGNATHHYPAILSQSAIGILNGTVIYFRGRSAAGDGGGGAFIYDSASSATADNIFVFQPASGPGKFVRIYGGEDIDIRWAGAKCDKTTDDAAAFQLAVNYCLLKPDVPALVVSGPCRLATSVFIDRAVDSTNSKFFIKATNNGCIYTDTAIDIFKSTFTIINDPLSECVHFIGLRFEASTNTLNARVLQGSAFLRMEFSKCYFDKIRLARTERYFQSYYFENCTQYRIKGYFMEAAYNAAYGANSGGGYDIHTVGNQFEKGSLGEGVPTQFCKLDKFCVGSSFFGGNYEGSNGPMFSAGSTLGVACHGVYFEENLGRDVIFGDSRGSSMSGCFSYNTKVDHWMADVAGLSFSGSGNYTNRNMYFDNMNVQVYSAGLSSKGDMVEGQLLRSIPSNGGVGDFGGVTGIFTAVLTGYAADIPIVVAYRKNDRIVTLSWPATAGASTSSFLRMRSMPAGLLPLGRICSGLAIVRDNSGPSVAGLCEASVDGIDFYSTLGGPTVASFASTGTKGIGAGSFTYLI